MLMPSGAIFLLILIAGGLRGWNWITKSNPLLETRLETCQTNTFVLNMCDVNMRLSLTLCCRKACSVLSPNAILRCVIFTLRICPLFTWRRSVRVFLRLSLKLIFWHASYFFPSFCIFFCDFLPWCFANFALSIFLYHWAAFYGICWVWLLVGLD